MDEILSLIERDFQLCNSLTQQDDVLFKYLLTRRLRVMYRSCCKGLLNKKIDEKSHLTYLKGFTQNTSLKPIDGDP